MSNNGLAIVNALPVSGPSGGELPNKAVAAVKSKNKNQTQFESYLQNNRKGEKTVEFGEPARGFTPEIESKQKQINNNKEEIIPLLTGGEPENMPMEVFAGIISLALEEPDISTDPDSLEIGLSDDEQMVIVNEQELSDRNRQLFFGNQRVFPDNQALFLVNNADSQLLVQILSDANKDGEQSARLQHFMGLTAEEYFPVSVTGLLADNAKLKTPAPDKHNRGNASQTGSNFPPGTITENNLKLQGNGEIGFAIQKQDGTDVKQIMFMESNRLAAVPNNMPPVAGGENDQPLGLPVIRTEAQEQPAGRPADIAAVLLTAGGNTEGDEALKMPGGKESVFKAWPQPQEIIDQVVKKAEIMLKSNLTEMRIELKPEFLGRMLIKIVLEDGILTARFTAENNHIKNMLEANMANLRQSLEMQGIKVEKTEVDVQLGGNNLFNGSEQERHQELWQRFQEQSQDRPEYFAPLPAEYETEDDGYDMAGLEVDTGYHGYYQPDNVGQMDLTI